MDLGPIEVIILAFPGNKFSGEIAPALAEVVDKEIVRIIDLTFVMKDEDGNVSSLEIDTIDPEVAAALRPVTDDVMSLLSEDDVAQVAESLPNNTSAALLVFEQLWDDRLRAAIINANGRLLDRYSIPRDVVEAALEARPEST